MAVDIIPPPVFPPHPSDTGVPAAVPPIPAGKPAPYPYPLRPLPVHSSLRAGVDARPLFVLTAAGRGPVNSLRL